MRHYLTIVWYLSLFAVVALGPYYRIDWDNFAVDDPIVSSYIGGAGLVWLSYKLRNLFGNEGGQD